MFRYAQIDSNGMVISDSLLSGEVNLPHMIRISDDFSLANKKYVNGEWIEYEPIPSEPEVTCKEILLDVAENTENILQKLNEMS